MTGDAGGTAAPGLRLVEETGSTNDDAKALALEGAPAGAAVAALRQTAGRGRRGHAWASPPGSLALSVVLRPDVPMPFFVGLPAVCSLGVLDALRLDAGVGRAALKWPNDVVLDGGKLAGVLVEAGCGPAGAHAVCGVGVNVERGPGAREGAPRGGEALLAAYVADALPDGAAPGIAWLAEAVRDRVCARADAWARAVRAGRAAAGPLAPVLDELFDSMPMLGRRVRALRPDGSPMGEGVLRGIDAWGRAIVLMDADGREAELSSEQASLRLATGGPA